MTFTATIAVIYVVMYFLTFALQSALDIIEGYKFVTFREKLVHSIGLTIISVFWPLSFSTVLGELLAYIIKKE